MATKTLLSLFLLLLVSCGAYVYESKTEDIGYDELDTLDRGRKGKERYLYDQNLAEKIEKQTKTSQAEMSELRAQEERVLQEKNKTAEAEMGAEKFKNAIVEDEEQAIEPEIPSGCPEGCDYQKPGCDIKGNISINTQDKIFHVPGGEYYEETVIRPEYGEKWFCTEEEAKANGWRKSKK